MMKLNSHFLSLPLFFFLFLFLSPSSATYNHKSPSPPAPDCHQPSSPVPSDKPSSPVPSHKPPSPVPSSKPPSPVPSSHKPYYPVPRDKPSSPVPSSKPPSPVPSSKPYSPVPPSHKPPSPVPSSKPPSPVPSPASNNQPSSPVPSPVSYTPTSSSPSPLSDSPSSPSPPLDGSYKGCFSKVFAFGDSYTDTGNAQFMGEIASSGSKNRLSNGRMVIDYLCDALSIPPLSPYKDSNGNFDNGVNFAVSGSTCLPKDCFTNGTIPHALMFDGAIRTVETQIEWFHEHVQNVACKGKDVDTCKTEMSKSLFWIGAMGVTDYTRASGSSSFNIQRIADMSITHMSKLMQTLLESGAKNIVVHGLPPVGCLSSGISLCPSRNYDKMGCSMTTNTAVMIHNKILQRTITRFQSQFPQCKILYADYWNAYMKIFTNKKQYHFEEPFKACCGAGDGKLNFNLNSVCGSPGTSSCKDPSKYMNWDGIHLTESMQHHLSDLFLNQNFCRPSFSQFFKNKMGGI
ncbi:GDSL esterase/lipase At3g48460-like [Cornus florida]|uniref:GDSL esterase/lipase At3g48460-like n=1 Tax=Cornus florida TaxID=4283 RepID=UPI00289CC496|nr:GDSL esterase/lipase At3g48460-like [Cornus florida]